MKLPTVLALSALALTTLAPRPAAADGDEALAAIGGFIGGVIVGSHLDRDHDRSEWHSRYDRHHRRGPVVIERCAPPPRWVGRDRGSRHEGYWSERTVRVWVPGRWVWSIDDCGRRVRYREPGHYEYRRERVWVE